MKSIWHLLASQTKVRALAIKVIAAVWLLMSQAPALIAQDLTGTTEGVFSVSPTGAFNYTIPIKVLDGYSDYSPQISLVYNSQGINGMVGIGWGLSGLSSMTAVGHNRYYDGSDISGVSVSRNDAFSLDGQRLLLVSGTNGHKGAEYTTEEESWSLISVDSSFDATPKSFIVKSPDGSVHKYGSSTGLFRYPNPDGDSAIGWLIDYQEDIDGNYIEYAYSCKDGIPYISEIRYGGNRLAGVLPGHVITFAYEARPDTFARTIKTATYLCTQRLRSIACGVNGNEYRRYTLTYDNTFYYSHLVTVKESGAAGAAYPELAFEWNGFPSLTPSAANVTVDESVLYTPSKSYYISGDVDNDGVSELVSITPRPLQEANSVVRVYKKSGGTFALDGSYTASGHYEWSGLISSALRGGLLAHIGSAQSNSIVVPVLRTDIDGNHLIRFDLPMEGYSYQNILSYTDEIPAYTIADFDKDGKDEVIYVEKKSVGDNKISLVKIDFDTSAQSASDSVTDVSVFSCGNGKIRDCLSADFDGDGLVDMLVLLDDCGVVLWNDNGIFGSYTRLSNIKYADTMQPCDINRDERVDLLINEHNSASWLLALNTGSRSGSLFSVSQAASLSSMGIRKHADSDGYDSTYYCLPCDLNSDGRMEFVIGYQSGGMVKTSVAESSFDGALSVLHTSPSVLPAYCTKQSHTTLGDFDGDGRVELLNYGCDLITGSSNGGRSWHYYAVDSATPSTGRITAVTDGLGKLTSVTYKSLVDGYTNNCAADFPLLQFHSPLSVVSVIDETYNGKTYSNSYSYSDGVFHMQGKGFLGFGSMSATHDSLSTTTTRQFNTDYCVSYVSAVNTSDLSGNTHEAYEYTYDLVSGRALKSFEKRLTHESYGNALEPGNVTASYGNFHYGQAQTVTTGSEISKTTTYSFRDVTDNGKWILCQPAEVRTESVSSVTASGSSDHFYEKTVYTYDSDNRISSKAEYCTDSPSLYHRTGLESYTYNQGGKVLSESLKPYSSSESMVTSRQYDQYGRLIHTTGPDGHETAYSYDVYGQLAQETDLRFGTIRTYTNDGMGRRLQAILSSQSGAFLPDTTKYIYEASDDAKYAYRLVTKRTFSPTTIEYYDGFGRNAASSSIHFDGTEHISERTYLNRLVVSFESSPHKKGTGSTVGTAYEYDGILRPVRITDAGGNATTFTYYDNAREVTSSGMTTYYEYDNDGRLSARTDNSCSGDGYGDVVYTYRANGGYDRVFVCDLSGDDVSVAYGYDTYGRVSSVTSANDNTESYGYDQYGNMSTIIRDGKTETRTYNKYGEIKAKTSVTQATATTSASYIYDNKHQLTNVYSGNRHTAYTYDNAGRMTVSRVEVADPDNANCTYYIQTSYLYDGPDRVIQTTSAMDDAVPTLVERYGYSNGWETGVWLNNSLVWKLESETDLGKVYSSSNGVRRTQHAYDNNGRLTSYAAFRIPDNSSPYAFSHNYTYNEKGFPVSMDGKTLTYDAYNRLSAYNGQNYTYDFKGNITISGAQGSVSYDGYKLRGVTSPNTAVWGTSGRTIRTNGNKQPYMISQSDTTAVFHYDADWNRTSMSVYTGIDLEDSLDADGNLTEHPSGYSYNRIYCGDRYEVYHNSRFAPVHYYYVGGTPETAYAVAEISMGVVRLSYIYRDIQGSITELMDTTGNVTHFYYDPWGRQCDSSHTPYANGYSNGSFFIRGYLSQEYYAEFGLQNLNARLYSPHIGRFLSPDPLIDTEGDVFGFNPYIYGRNNPCVYVDPDGRFPWLIVGAAAIGGTINLALNWDKADNFWKGLGYFSIGAGVGALTAMCPTGVGLMEGVMYGGLSGALGGGVAGGLNALFFGDDIGMSIGRGMTCGAITGALLGGVLNTADAVTSGRNWWTGKSSAGKLEHVLEMPNQSETVKPVQVNTIQNTQNHHIVSPKNKSYIKKFKGTTDKYNLSLEGSWNKVPISKMYHNGRHPNDYHDWIYKGLIRIDAESNLNRELFLQKFEIEIKIPLLKQPKMLGKDYWLNKYKNNIQ